MQRLKGIYICQYEAFHLTLRSWFAIIKYEMTGTCFKIFCLVSASTFLNTVLFLVGISALISCCVLEPEHSTWNSCKACTLGNLQMWLVPFNFYS